MKRPGGITILALLHFLEAILFLLVGVMLFLVVQLLAQVGSDAVQQAPDEMTRRTMTLLLEWIQSGEMVAVYAVLVVLALVFIVVGVGLWGLRPWSRVLTLALMALRLLLLLPGLIFSLVQFEPLMLTGQLVFVVLYAWIVWYLFQPEVKRAFGVA
ncbi:MAG TPA: hypothetical protein VLB32_08070 [Candidatus Acidoferrales bacterium]|nr:hypothetical protein [Candidatus Acidoferrales bacterium]